MPPDPHSVLPHLARSLWATKDDFGPLKKYFSGPNWENGGCLVHYPVTKCLVKGMSQCSQDAIFSVFGNGMSSVVIRLVISPYTYIGIGTG